MSKGLYCEVHGNFTLTPSKVKSVDQRMREIVEQDEPFERKVVSMEEARKSSARWDFTINWKSLNIVRRNNAPIHLWLDDGLPLRLHGSKYRLS